MTISAVHVTRLSDPTAKRRHLCGRCGRARKDARPGAILCRDCKEVLTHAELEAWGVGHGVIPCPSCKVEGKRPNVKNPSITEEIEAVAA